MIKSYMQKNDDNLVLLSTVKRFIYNIMIQFGLDKCAKVIFKKYS